MRVVVAPDKFKGSASAPQVAAAISAGLRRARPDLDVVEIPVADGGDGTVAAALAAGFAPVSALAEGPTGAPVDATFAMLAMRAGRSVGSAGSSAGGSTAGGSSAGGSTAVVELADVAGLRRLPGGDVAVAPLTASTYGVGQVIAAALDAGATEIVLGIGGSASTDGGAGMVQALGIGLSDQRGHNLARGGAALRDLAAIRLDGLDPRIAGVRLLVASDVDNPLLGPAGAAAVFGPQKGADGPQIDRLEAGLARLAGMLGGDPGAPGAGAAGGTGYGLATAWGAVLAPGAAELCRLAGLDRLLAATDLVITGEGRFDATSLTGKVCGTVLAAAAAAGTPVALVAGQVSAPAAEGLAAVVTLAGLAGGTAAALASPAHWLHQAGEELARDTTKGMP